MAKRHEPKLSWRANGKMPRTEIELASKWQNATRRNKLGESMAKRHAMKLSWRANGETPRLEIKLAKQWQNTMNRNQFCKRVARFSASRFRNLENPACLQNRKRQTLCRKSISWRAAKTQKHTLRLCDIFNITVESEQKTKIKSVIARTLVRSNL